MEFAGSALNGGFGCRTLGSWPVFSGLTCGIYLWAFTKQLQHRPSHPLSMDTSISSPVSWISLVSRSQLHISSSSQHWLCMEALPQRCFAQSLHEMLCRMLTTAPMSPFTFSLKNFHRCISNLNRSIVLRYEMTSGGQIRCCCTKPCNLQENGAGIG